MTGFVIFLLSESIIFPPLLPCPNSRLPRLPDGVEGLEVRMPLINSVVLVSSSFVAYFAERYLHKGNLWGFRAVWFLTMAMGTYFVYGQYGSGPNSPSASAAGCSRRVLSAHRLSRPACDHRHPADGPDVGSIVPSKNYDKGEMGGAR